MSRKINDKVDVSPIVNNAKSLLKIPSDAKLAELLGLSPQDFNKRKKIGSILPLLIILGINEKIDMNELIFGKAASQKNHEAAFPLAQELDQWWQEQNYSANPERKSWFKCQLLDSFPSFAKWLKQRTESADIDSQPAPEQIIASGQTIQIEQGTMTEEK